MSGNVVRDFVENLPEHIDMVVMVTCGFCYEECSEAELVSFLRDHQHPEEYG